ncbi:hypothetical protein CYMTET_22878 [Cymbomonas tetramitiformis]|uniref:Uncharacterized protein n=1 Tax=Cymbomonas tetramitiformis TaxID=36881 RepID=A0AAE0FZH4_9CHLO|nr:hypothetical protein CYMTET_22878 [Cymbomonas tetramitiformis]
MEVHFLTTDASTHNFEARVDAGKLHKATSSRHHDTAKPKGPLRLAPIKGNWERSTQVQYKPEPMSRSEGVNDSIDRSLQTTGAKRAKQMKLTLQPEIPHGMSDSFFVGGLRQRTYFPGGKKPENEPQELGTGNAGVLKPTRSLSPGHAKLVEARPLRGIHCKDTPTVSSSGRLDGSGKLRALTGRRTHQSMSSSFQAPDRDTKGLKNSIQSLKRELAQLGVKINEDGHEVVRFDNELMATSQRQWADGMPVNEEGSFTTWPGHLIRRRPALTLQERLSTNQNEGQGMKATVTKHLQKQAQRQLQEEHDDVMALKWNVSSSDPKRQKYLSASPEIPVLSIGKLNRPIVTKTGVISEEIQSNESGRALLKRVSRQQPKIVKDPRDIDSLDCTVPDTAFPPDIKISTTPLASDNGHIKTPRRLPFRFTSRIADDDQPASATSIPESEDFE